MLGQFTFAEVAEAADIPVASLRSWYQQGHFGLTKADQAAPVGGTRLLSRNTTLAVAICAAFTRAGVSVPIAAQAAMTFAHTNSGGPPRSLPGTLYPGSAATIILVAGSRNKIFPVSRKSNPFEMLSMPGDGNAGTFVLVNPIITRLEKRLRFT
jgi:hypothetical protein